MLNLSLRPHSQSYFHNQRGATLLIKLACWQSVFTVCVNAPLWGSLRKSSARSYWFSPLKANSFSWVSAVHSDPAVNIDFSVFSSQCVCVCAIRLFNSCGASQRRTARLTTNRNMCFNHWFYCHITTEIDFTVLLPAQFVFRETSGEICLQSETVCVCVCSELSFIFKTLESHLIPGVFAAPWMSEEIRALLSNLVFLRVHTDVSGGGVNLTRA